MSDTTASNTTNNQDRRKFNGGHKTAGRKPKNVTTATFTIDSEVLAKAREKYPNKLSKLITDYLACLVQ